MDMYDFKSHNELGSANGSGSGSWGWTFFGREYALIGQSDGVAFAEVMRDGKLQYIGRLPQQHTALPSQWCVPIQKSLQLHHTDKIVGAS